MLELRPPGGWASGGLGVVLRSPLTLVPSSRGTTSLGSDGPPASWAWCFTPRKSLFLRQRAPRLWDQMGRPPGGRGASLPASPCSFVNGHHAFGAGWDFSRVGVVLRSPLALVPSSRGTTFLGSDGPPASWAWCFTPRKPLFLRQRAPRLWGRMGLRQVGRGAPLPANPCFFVAGHHISGVGWASGKLGVVLRSPQTLVPSLPGTTPLGPDGQTAGWAWCSVPRKPLFLRQRAPRLWGRMGRPPGGRGAPLPANPCFFVAGHHVSGVGWVFGDKVRGSARTALPKK